MEGIEIEMGRDDLPPLVGRILNRREIIDFTVLGDDDNPPWVLARRYLDPLDLLRQSIDLGAAQSPAVVGEKISGKRREFFSA